MRLLSISFLLGILSIQQLSHLPALKLQLGFNVSPYLFIFLLVITLSAVFYFTTFQVSKKHASWKYLLLTGLVSGCTYALWAGDSILSSRILPSLEGEDLIVSGYVSSIPQQRQNGWRFRLKVDKAFKLNDPTQSVPVNGVIRLGWYRTNRIIHAGEKWQMVVRLKQPAGFMNPGGFDYEKWLFQQRVIATGYVRDKPQNVSNIKLLAKPNLLSINSYRESILSSIKQHINDPNLASIVGALAVADRAAITDEQWEILRQTGTNHLVAISGLHIGMVAGFGFFPVMLIWWLFPTLYKKIPVKVAGGVLGAIFAIAYALLAGFTLPTQRALMMVLVILIGLVSRKRYANSTILAIALLMVLLYDPLAVLSQGFWLSFVAVGLIMFTVSRHISRPRLLYDIISIQLVLSIGMLPLTLAFFGTGSLSSPLANMLAIPWVTLIVVPLTLLGVLFIPVSSISSVLFNLAGESVSVMMKGLELLSSSDFMINLAQAPSYVLLLSFLGLLWLWMPSKFPARWLGLVFILPLFIYRDDPINHGAFTFHLLDVGQGLASVVQTKDHTLIYDTGPRASASFDTGKLVVVPFLRSKNINHIDTLMISHEDMDHRGGSVFIHENISVGTIMGSDITLFNNMKDCEQGDKWIWDGVTFEVLHPKVNWQGSDNDRSCVIRVSNKSHSLLLTGDIEKVAEKQILNDKLVLKSEVMTMPHHGSNTSSSRSFLEAVQPELAVAGTGYRNRFHFPAKKTVAHYQQRGIAIMTTVDHGAIRLHFPEDDKDYRVESYRDSHQHYWNKKSNGLR